MLTIQLEGVQNVKELLGADVKKALSDAVFDIAGIIDNEATINIKDRIYGKPPSPRYRRTGSALGGRANESLGDMKRKVVNDTRLKGRKSKNYAPMLNKNRRIKRFNTHYWDDAVETAEEKAKTIVQDKLKKAFNGNLK